MKKLLLVLLLMFSVAHGEMIWMSINPAIQASNKSAQASLESGGVSRLGAPDAAGFDCYIQVNDSSANADSTYMKLYSHCINTEGVVSATGFITVISITDTSTTGASAFSQYGDSIAISYAVKTAYEKYSSTNFDLVALGDLTAVSGTALNKPITLKAATVGVDTLFKPYTWIELTFSDSTRWGDLYTQYWRIYGSGDSAATIAGTYNAVGPDFFKYWIYDPDTTDVDSFIWCHWSPSADTTGTPDTTAITGSAQNLDSGMTINWDATIDHVPGDTFAFVAADSLWYGKKTSFKIKMGLNVLRK